jgi:hypothetical protein
MFYFYNAWKLEPIKNPAMPESRHKLLQASTEAVPKWTQTSMQTVF